MPIRLMFIGDSLTAGSDDLPGSFRTHRGRVLARLAAEGLDVDAIGRVSRPPAIGGDPDCEAYGGAFISHPTDTNNIATRIPGAMTAAGTLDVIVSLIGWNDGYNYPTDAANRYTNDHFNPLRAAQPNAIFIATTLTPQRGQTEAQTAAELPAYAAINARVRQTAATQPKVYLADAAQLPLVFADYWDVIHWLQSGADKVGDLIADTIIAALDAETAPPTAAADVTTFYRQLTTMDRAGPVGATRSRALASPPLPGATVLGHGSVWRFGGLTSNIARVYDHIGDLRLEQQESGNNDNVFSFCAIRENVTLPPGGAPYTMTVEFTQPDTNRIAWCMGELREGTVLEQVAKSSTLDGAVETLVTGSALTSPRQVVIGVGGGFFTSVDVVADTDAAGGGVTPPSQSVVDQMVSDMGSHRDIWNPFPYLNPGGTQAYSGATLSGCDTRYNAKASWWPGPQYPEYPYWNWMLPWHEFWAVPGHTGAPNTCVEVGDIELLTRNDGGLAWVIASYERAAPGNIFAVQTGGGSGIAIELPPSPAGHTRFRITAAGGQLYHGYGRMTQVNGPTLRVVQARFRARKALINPSGVDDRAGAVYAGHGGCDLYPDPSVPASVFAGAGVWGIGLTKCKVLTNDWQWFYLTPLGEPPSDTDKSFPYNFRQFITEAEFRANPPPAPTL